MILGLAFGDARSEACVYDQKAFLAEGLEAFDQDVHVGWRSLADKGCLPEAADLIFTWRAAHADLPHDRVMEIAWHEGQMRAASSDTKGAISAMSLELENSDPAMRDYAAATIAFLKRDRAGLIAARARLAAEPKPEGWDAAAADFKARYGQTLVWPDNLDVVDGLIACYGKSYKLAYACRPKD